ncbi:MAG: hypothetical protein ACREKE_06990 [bacterium]
MRRPLPPPEVPGKTDAERMDNGLRRILAVPKDEFLKEEAKHRHPRKPSKRR